MTDKYYYRIKTEEEFRRQFGDEIFNNLAITDKGGTYIYYPQMSALFGKTIPRNRLELFIHGLPWGERTREKDIFDEDITGHNYIIGGISWLARVRVRP
jgi:hypothetical protein